VTVAWHLAYILSAAHHGWCHSPRFAGLLLPDDALPTGCGLPLRQPRSK